MISNTSKFSIFTHPITSENGPNKSIETENGVFNDLFFKYPYDRTYGKPGEHINLTYGEISSIDTLRVIFSKIKAGGGLKGDEIFYDLGSGIGKPVLAASLLHKFKKCIGIEILKDLCDISIKVLDEYTRSDLNCANEIQFNLGSFLDLNFIDWTDADVVFANSTCFDNKTMESLSGFASNMKSGSYFISLTNELNEKLSGFPVIDELRLETSWGMADFFIHKKI